MSEPMLSLPYGTVTGRYIVIKHDGADEDLLPDVQPLNGSVLLTPTVTAGGVEGALAEIAPVRLRIFGGQIVDDQQNPGARILANDADMVVEDWAWKAQVTFEESKLRLKPQTFKLATGETVSLTAGLIPVESAPYQLVEGPAGASVTGARDNGDSTVTFLLSNGTETAPVPIPPGPAGRGIASISDPDTDGRVTITYSDETTSTVQAIRGADGHSPVLSWDGTSLVVDGEIGPDLQGAPGTDSTVPGPPPSVSWDGDRLVVGGEPSPPLTGPDGPAPSVAWQGDRLTVGGVQGPSLMGPASTVPGPPGAVPTASDYLVVGPGRPDTPTTTALTAAQLAALPVGCEYRSTDWLHGARMWLKGPNGWVVTVGDTGLRSLTLPTGWSGRLTIQRVGATVTLAATDLWVLSGSTTSGPTRPAGFAPPADRGGLTLYPARQPAALPYGIVFFGGRFDWGGAQQSALVYNGGITQYPTTDPWPTSLPGAAA